MRNSPLLSPAFVCAECRPSIGLAPTWPASATLWPSTSESANRAPPRDGALVQLVVKARESSRFAREGLGHRTTLARMQMAEELFGGRAPGEQARSRDR